MRDVAGPRAQRGVKPGNRQDRKDGPDGFMEELLESAPEAAKTALRRRCGGANGGAHGNILAQKSCRLVLRVLLGALGREIARFDREGMLESGLRSQAARRDYGRIGDKRLTVACIRRNVGLE
jgi:hypothetical protein